MPVMSFATFVGIALLIVGTTATLAAFGGKTWIEGPEPVLERVTIRGWVSIACLAAALVLGISKQVGDNREKDAAAKAAMQERAEAEREHAKELQAAAATEKKLQDQLAIALLQLEHVKALNEAHVSHLADLQDSLKGTRRELSEQTAAGMANVLAQTDQQISRIILALPLTARAHKPGNDKAIRAALLPVFREKSCYDLSSLGIHLADTPDQPSFFAAFHFAGDESEAQSWFKGRMFVADRLMDDEVVDDPDDVVDLPDAQVDRINTSIGQQSSNGAMYLLEMRPAKIRLSAAKFYAEMTRPGIIPMRIELRWPPRFKNVQEFTALRDRYPSLLGMMGAEWMQADAEDFLVGKDRGWHPPYPCGSQVLDYFRTAFEKATLTVVLEQSQREAIIFHLRATKPKHTSEGGISERFTLEFAIESAPSIRAGVDDLYEPVLASWPEQEKAADDEH